MTGLIVVGAFVAMFGLLAFMIKREKGIIDTLKREGITVEVPIESFSSRRNSNDNMKYYIHYKCNGKYEDSEVTRYDYDRLQTGQMVPVTYGQGHVRYNIYQQNFPVMFAPGYENQQNMNNTGDGIIQNIVDGIFGNGNSQQNPNYMHQNDNQSGLNINIENNNYNRDNRRNFE